MWGVWVALGAFTTWLVILTLIDIHDTKKRYQEDIEKRDRILQEQREKDIERLQRQAQRELADDGYFIPK